MTGTDNVNYENTFYDVYSTDMLVRVVKIMKMKKQSNRLQQKLFLSDKKIYELLMKFTEAKNTNFTIVEDNVC
jgi:hypothetical protein